MSRVSLKAVGTMAVAESTAVDAQDRKDALFQYSASCKVIEQLVTTVESCLISTRNPLMRAQTVIEQFLSHPDVRKVIMSSQQGHWSWDPKQQRVITHVIDQLTAAIAEHKNKTNDRSRLLYQTIMNIVSPPPGQNLMRATARLFGLKSRRGLTAGASRVAQRQVELEGSVDCFGLFIPGEKKTRSDVTAESHKRTIDAWWKTCRVTANVRNVVRPRRSSGNQEWHPIHWLEHTERKFYELLLLDGDHYYTDQLLLSGLTSEDAVDALDVRRSFKDVLRVKKGGPGHFYVTFSDAQACMRALSLGTRSAGLNIVNWTPVVTKRPLFGFTIFRLRRPYFVKNIGATTCVCSRCYDFKLKFQSFMKFEWEHVCPPVAELIESIRALAGTFSPSEHTLLTVLLCEPSGHDTYFDYKCCSTTCVKNACGWTGLGQLVVKDTIVEAEAEVANTICWKSYGTVQEVTDVKGAGEDDQRLSTTKRPQVIIHESPPSAFLALFEDALGDYMAHKYVAVWQTRQEQLLKTLLMGRPRVERRILISIDFAENYTILHQTEGQSEYWSHMQVTLFICIAHYRVEVKQTDMDSPVEYKVVSEAHIGVSGDVIPHLYLSRCTFSSFYLSQSHMFVG